MTPTNPLDSRRPDTTGRRPRVRRGTALWLALFVGGVALIVIATLMLLAASSARTQAMVAEHRYFAPTTTGDPGSSTAAHDPVSGLPGSVATPTPATKATVGQHSRSRPGPVSTGLRPSIGVSPVIKPPSVPTSIELAGSHNLIRVVPIGVSAAGVLEPPSDISTAGWWVSGPRPGAPGRAVITGHIDSTAGLGAFAALDLLRDGDTISLHEADGRTLHFTVTARQQIQKTQLDPRLLQHTTNSSDLLLVTCIGNFDYSTRSYDSNLLITAVPVAQ